MTREVHDAGSNIVPVRKGELAPRSQDLVQRGLQSLSAEEERTVRFPPNSSLGTLYIGSETSLVAVFDYLDTFRPLAEKPSVRLVDARGTITTARQEKILLDVSASDTSLTPLANLSSDALWGLVSTFSRPKKLTDPDVAQLAGLTGLRRLSLWGWEITDAGLESLKGMATLGLLDIHSGRIAGVGLAYLTGLAR